MVQTIFCIVEYFIHSFFREKKNSIQEKQGEDDDERFSDKQKDFKENKIKHKKEILTEKKPYTGICIANLEKTIYIYSLNRIYLFSNSANQFTYFFHT